MNDRVGCGTQTSCTDLIGDGSDGEGAWEDQASFQMVGTSTAVSLSESGHGSGPSLATPRFRDTFPLIPSWALSTSFQTEIFPKQSHARLPSPARGREEMSTYVAVASGNPHPPTVVPEVSTRASEASSKLTTNNAGVGRLLDAPKHQILIPETCKSPYLEKGSLST